MSNRLFILISNTLRGSRKLSLPEHETEVLVLPQNRLTVEKEPALDANGNPVHPDPWEAELKLLVVERIKLNQDWKGSRVRVAGHLRPCFGSLAKPDRREDQRFPEIEDGLKEELQHEIDVQIWGFHREEEWSHIWRVAREIQDWISDDARKIDFLNALEEAFDRSAELCESKREERQTQEIWERLSVLKHDIIGLFDPSRIRLANAHEIRDEDPSRAAEIRASVQASIQPKLETARKLLDDSKLKASGDEATKWLLITRELLESPPELAKFPDWLNQVDDSLNNLRKIVTK